MQEFFLEQGYRRAGQLLVLARPTEGVCGARAVAQLRFQRVRSCDQVRLIRLVERTYEGSLDFPLLNGIQEPAAALARYAEAGDSGIRHWWIVRAEGHDVGCLLMTAHARWPHCELAYLGLVPRVRGRRWARCMVAFALSEATAQGKRQLVLGVDAANDPAVATYAAAGFVEAGRKTVLFKGF